MTRYAIGLGSNLGDRHDHLVEACAEIGRRLGEFETSALYETEPVGGPDQDPYLNAVVVVMTDLTPLEVLDVLQEIERSRGRERQVRWGPRTLDLDLIASDGQVSPTSRLTIPHPRAAEREFVLRPLADVWPEAPVAPGLDATTALAALGDQGVDRLVREWLPPLSRWPSRALLTGQFFLVLAVAIALAFDGSLPEGEVTVARVIGAMVAFVGLILAFIASRRLGSALTAGPIPNSEGELVTSGPYRFARHPIYGGLSLFLMGTALLVDSVSGFFVALLLVPYFMFKAAYEERHLRLRYPGYLAYKLTVPRWLIPFVV